MTPLVSFLEQQHLKMLQTKRSVLTPESQQKILWLATEGWTDLMLYQILKTSKVQTGKRYVNFLTHSRLPIPLLLMQLAPLLPWVKNYIHISFSFCSNTPYTPSSSYKYQLTSATQIWKAIFIQWWTLQTMLCQHPIAKALPSSFRQHSTKTSNQSTSCSYSLSPLEKDVHKI